MSDNPTEPTDGHTLISDQPAPTTFPITSPASEVHHEIEPLVRTVMEQHPELAAVRRVMMQRPMLEVPCMSLGRRLTKASAEDVPTSFGSVKLVSSKLTIPVSLTNEYLSDNPTKDEDELAKQFIAAVVGNDLADLAFNGDEELHDDRLLCATDGWLKRMMPLRRPTLRRRHVLRRELSMLIASLDPAFKRDRKALRFFVSPDTYQDAIEHALETSGPSPQPNATPMVDGVPLIMAPFMPHGSVLLTNPDNLILGFEFLFKIRKTREGKQAIERDEVLFAGHIRAALAVQNPEAGFHYTAWPWHEVFGRTGAFVAARYRRTKWAVERMVRRLKNRLAERSDEPSAE